MSNAKTRLKKSLDQSIRKMWTDWRAAKDRQFETETLIDLLPTEVLSLADRAHVGSLGWPITLQYRLDLALMKKIEDLMNNAGFIGQDRRTCANYVARQFNYPDFRYFCYVSMTFVEEENSTCKIVKIGEERSERIVPVFEAVCREGAEEGW